MEVIHSVASAADAAVATDVAQVSAADAQALSGLSFFSAVAEDANYLAAKHF